MSWIVGMEKTHTNVLPFLFFLSLYRSDLQLLVILFYNRATPLYTRTHQYKGFDDGTRRWSSWWYRKSIVCIATFIVHSWLNVESDAKLKRFFVSIS